MLKPTYNCHRGKVFRQLQKKKPDWTYEFNMKCLVHNEIIPHGKNKQGVKTSEGCATQEKA